MVAQPAAPVKVRLMVVPTLAGTTAVPMVAQTVAPVAPVARARARLMAARTPVVTTVVPMVAPTARPRGRRASDQVTR